MERNKTLNNFLAQIDKFRMSGLTLNYDKTHIMRIGSLRNADARFYTLKPLHWVDPFSQEGIKVLGVKLGTQEALDKLVKIVGVWQRRNLNIMGRIVIINSLMLSITVYKVLMLTLPSAKFIKSVKQRILDFLWDGKPPQICYPKAVLVKADGGLNLVDIDIKK